MGINKGEIKMQVKIKETGEIKELSYYCNTQDIEDCTRDIIFNTGDQDQFSYDEENDIYITSQENFEWWEDWFKRDRLAKIASNEILAECVDSDYDGEGNKIVNEYEDFKNELNNVCGDDFESLPERIMEVVEGKKESKTEEKKCLWLEREEDCGDCEGKENKTCPLL